MCQLMKRSLQVATMAGLSWGAAAGLWAQSQPLGDDFQVNVITERSQQIPRVAADNQGNFMVVWKSLAGTGGTSGRQLFADGTLGDEMFITPSWPPDIGRAAGGEFVVAYEVLGSGVRAKAFDASGNPQGNEMIVYEGPGANFRTVVDMADNKEFVVAWTHDSGILARQMSFDGTPLGDIMQVETHTTDSQLSPQIDVASNGDFVVTWTSWSSPGNDNSDASVQGRAFSASGIPKSGQFQVNTVTARSQTYPSVTWLADGNLAFSWRDQSNEIDSDLGGIYLQRTTSSGQLLGTSMMINTYTTGRQWQPAIAGLDDGGFLVAWTSDGSPQNDSLEWSIQARVFDSKGVATVDQYQVNSYIPDVQGWPAVATAPDGQVLVVWHNYRSGGDDSDGESIHGRRFGLLVPEVFTDGFESGNTALWEESP